MRMVLDSPKTPLFPMTILLLPVVMFRPALNPIPILFEPLVLLVNDEAPAPCYYRRCYCVMTNFHRRVVIAGGVAT